MLNPAVKPYLPIKKVVVGLATSGVLYIAHRWLNLNLGSEDTATVIELFGGSAVSYIVRDPRVKRLASEAKKLVAEIEAYEEQYGSQHLAPDQQKRIAELERAVANLIEGKTGRLVPTADGAFRASFASGGVVSASPGLAVVPPAPESPESPDQGPAPQ